MKIDGLGEIAQRFDAMLIDQFGVIHDGQKLYPGALQALSELRRLRIPVAVLTNSGKRAAANCGRLVGMGIPRDYFVDVVSSGEIAYHTIPKVPAYLIGKAEEDYGFDNVAFVAHPGEAEIILILGTDAPRTSMAQYAALLKDLKLPAICGNPDKWMLTRQGLEPAPGAIAALYEEMGGHVTWIGKPYPAIYARALEMLGNPARALCIGDSAEHDVAGGQSAGLETLLVMTGISAGLDPALIEPEPDYIMESLRW